MSPFDILNSTADVYTVPAHEVAYTYEQQCAIAKFHAATGGRWTIEVVKADSTTMFMVSDGTTVVLDLALSTALRIARTEK